MRRKRVETRAMNTVQTSAPALPDGREVLAALKSAASERILILDGAMGTMIQQL